MGSPAGPWAELGSARQGQTDEAHASVRRAGTQLESAVMGRPRSSPAGAPRALRPRHAEAAGIAEKNGATHVDENVWTDQAGHAIRLVAGDSGDAPGVIGRVVLDCVSPRRSLRSMRSYSA